MLEEFAAHLDEALRGLTGNPAVVKVAASNEPPLPVAVIIAGRNYAQYLGDAIESVLRQKPQAREVIYVDNASTDGSLAIAYKYGIRTAVIGTREHNICACRNRGALMTTAPYLLFLDADDVLPAGYLKLVADAIGQDERLGFVFPRTATFGLWDTSGLDREGAKRSDLIYDNIACISCLVRRKAFDAVGGFGQLPMFQDWDLWLRITEQGWRFKRAPGAIFKARTHSNSMTATIQGRIHQYQEILSHRPITVFTPFGPGRSMVHRRILDSFSRLGLRWDKTTLLFYDNTGDAEQAAMFRDYLHGSPARNAVYLRDDTRIDYYDIVTRAELVPERMAEIWCRASKHFDGDFLLSIEDDVEPIPDNAVRKLFEGMASDVGAVTGSYYSRPMTARTKHLGLEWYTRPTGSLGLRDLQWLPGDLEHPPSDGCMTIGATGLGCLLIRRDILDGYTYDIGNPDGWRGQDFGVCRLLKERGKRLLIHWGVPCKHWYSETEFI